MSLRVLRSTLRFRLPRATNDPKAVQTIVARLRIRATELTISTGVRTTTSEWDAVRCRIKSSALHAVERNTVLRRLEQQVEQVLKDLDYEDVPVTKDRVLERLNRLARREAANTHSFFDYYDQWVKDCETTKRPNTISGYKTTRGRLLAYAQRRSVRLSFEALDKRLVQDLVNDLLRVEHLQNASVWDTVKHLKTFLHWAREEGHTESHALDSITKLQFSIVEPIGVRLTLQELKSLVDLDLSTSAPLSNARDLFVLQCTIGVRYGDLVRIAAAPERYITEDSLTLTTEKNVKQITIPLFETARRILTAGRAIHPISNQKLNAYIKKVAQLAGLTTPVVIQEVRGKDRKEKEVPKHEALSTHAAKRTFITLALAHGASVDAVMKVTGNTRSTIDRYVHLNDVETRAQIAKAEAALSV